MGPVKWIPRSRFIGLGRFHLDCGPALGGFEGNIEGVTRRKSLLECGIFALVTESKDLRMVTDIFLQLPVLLALTTTTEAFGGFDQGSV